MGKNFKGFIDIVGSHITLDGNGFLISSEYDSTTLKENGDPRNRVIDVKGSDVTIKNVFVKGFPVNGIYGMFNTEIYSVGIGTNFPNLVVKDSSFSNHGYGIAVVPAPEIWDERECLIENNKVFSNSQVGISTLGCTIKNNEINDNYIGISDQSAGQNIILENQERIVNMNLLKNNKKNKYTVVKARI